MMGSGAMDTAMARAQAILADDPDDMAAKERQGQVEETGSRIIEVLRTVYDPEIPVNIYELGLIYKIDVEDDDQVLVEMTLTSPHCPVAETLPGEVEQKVAAVEGVAGCEVKVVWDPPWNPSMMTEEAQLELGMIY
jgi:FeS assembly SUF system protein